MIKSFTIAERTPGQPQNPEILRYWKEKHGPLAARILPGVKKYIQNHPVAVPGIEMDVDRIAEMWWESIDSYQQYLQWRQTEDAKPLLEDEKKFSDPGRRHRFMAEEFVVVDRTQGTMPKGIVKTFAIAVRNPERPQKPEILRYWKEKHAPLAARIIPGVKKYVQNHPLAAPGFESDIDRIAEIWWESIEAYQNYLKWRQAEAGKELIEDEKRFSDPGRRLRFVAQEHLIMER
jgi:uncharacterized protein (TIGR02118 family)